MTRLLRLSLLALSALGRVSPTEISLFDSQGRPVAYVAVDTWSERPSDCTIYLWDGRPVAYLEENSFGGFHVYGFTGKHLGWFTDGVIYDHRGHAAGAIAEALASPTRPEPPKPPRRPVPPKGPEALPPLRPLLSLSWSEISLPFLLIGGVEETPASGIDPNSGLYHLGPPSPNPGGALSGAIAILNSIRAQQLADEADEQRALERKALELQVRQLQALDENKAQRQRTTEDANPAEPCESHWIKDVLRKGAVVELDDGSFWDVVEPDTMKWPLETNILVCGDRFVNSRGSEEVHVKKFPSAD